MKGIPMYLPFLPSASVCTFVLLYAEKERFSSTCEVKQKSVWTSLLSPQCGADSLC